MDVAVDEYRKGLGLNLSVEGAVRPVRSPESEDALSGPQGRSGHGAFDRAIDEHRKSLGVDLREAQKSKEDRVPSRPVEGALDEPEANEDGPTEVARAIVGRRSTEVGLVPDGKTAIRIARAIWEPIYGSAAYRQNQPIRAKLTQGVWRVEGTLARGMVGGVPYAWIRKSDGAVLGVVHTK